MKGNILTITLFLINPFLSFIFSGIKSFYKKTKLDIVLFCLFFGIIGFQYIPFVEYDIVRHYEYFHFINSLSYEGLIDLLLIKPDSGAWLMYYIIGIFTDNHQIIGFISSFIFYFTATVLILKTKNNINKQYSVILFLLFLSNFQLYSFNGIRNSMAISFFSLSIYKYLKNKKIQSYIYSFLSVIFHVSFLTIVLIFLFSRYIKKYNKTKIYTSIFWALVFIIFSKEIFIFLLEIFAKISSYGLAIKNKAYPYIYGIYSQEVTTSIYALLINRIFFYNFLIFFYYNELKNIKKYKTQENKVISKFLLLYYPYLFMTYFFPSIYDRNISNIFFIELLYLIKNECFLFKYIKKKGILALIILYIIIGLGINLKINYKNINPKIFYKSFPQLVFERVSKVEYKYLNKKESLKNSSKKIQTNDL